MPAGYPAATALPGETSSAQGRLVGRPNSSWFHQLPHRPMAWASGSAGVMAESPPCSGIPRRIAAQIPTATPRPMPPQMPRPPSQILKALSQWPW